MKSLKLSKYFEIKKPQYVYLKLTPMTSIRNYDSDKIAKAIASMYRQISKCIYQQNKKFFFEVQSKVCYIIYLERGKAEFYFIVPSSHLTLIKDKITDTWKGITVSVVPSLPSFSAQAVAYKLDYKLEDALSLATDRRTNTLLSSILNTISILEEGDKVGVFYNFIPTSLYGWRAEYKKTIEKFNEGSPIDKDKASAVFVFKYIINLLMQIIDMIMDVINLATEKEDCQKPTKMLSKSTLAKKDSVIIKTQILALSESMKVKNAIVNAQSICESFKVIGEDNELRYSRCCVKKFDPLNLPGNTMLMTPAECQNLIALPGRELLQEHKMIEKIDTYESEVPVQLQTGVMCIGTNTYRGKKTKAYLTNDFEYRNLSTVLIGPTRAGKSSLLQNLCKNAIDHGECVVIPDFISNNRLSADIESVIPENKKLILDMDDLENLEGMGYNEVWTTANKKPLEVYDSAKEQTSQFCALVDSINEDDKELAARMGRYLEAAANTVFINRGAFRDVIDVLRNYNARQKFISMVQPALQPYLREYIDTLHELDDRDKKTGETDTRISRILGILDRLNRLKCNTVMEIMLKNSCTQNRNIVLEIQKPQLIVIKMPEKRFKTINEKDFMTTYWLSKLWMSLQIRDWMIPDRKKRVKVNLIFDELYQVPQAQRLLTEKLSQMAKFDCKVIISCHYLGQIPVIRDELKAANSSYIMIAGCDKQNFKELHDELSPYEVEDLLNLKRYHALNLLRYEGGYAKLITCLPTPIK